MQTSRKPCAEDFSSTLCNSGALRRASRRVSQLYEETMAPIGLRVTQYSILRQIERAGPSALSELAQHLVMDRSTLGHNLRPLERDGLVELVVDPNDRRSRLIALTSAGRKKIAAALPLWNQAQQQFEAAFGQKRAEALRELLHEITGEEFAKKFAKD
jgi:DNA-binding MarR family transcriptional regulator